MSLNVSEKSLLLVDVFLDLMVKRISNKIITCNEKDAPWTTPGVKIDIRRNSRVCRKWVEMGKMGKSIFGK